MKRGSHEAAPWQLTLVGAAAGVVGIVGLVTQGSVVFAFQALAGIILIVGGLGSNHH